jgi:hypothetical protein
VNFLGISIPAGTLRHEDGTLVNLVPVDGNPEAPPHDTITKAVVRSTLTVLTGTPEANSQEVKSDG